MNTSSHRWEVQLLLRGQTQTARGSGAGSPSLSSGIRQQAKTPKKKKLPDAKQDMRGDEGERIPPFSIDLKHSTH